MRQIDADEENSPSIRRIRPSSNANFNNLESPGKSNFCKDE